ncbi:TetR/AcrR family transcriptional regulator [Weissella sagaensis]|uniref:TetR/AcrR family transcriptional regulator n=1 Tax=Weissella sagaensis TaxID=2559928 RepID=UPI00214A9450|nr:TetR-like C-terminal domain-containing protein [Weissella sagaensis]
MKYSTQENIRVKKQLVDALFRLLAKQPLSSITVTSLIKEAHVARGSYYRNFDTIEDILEYYFRNITKDRIYQPKGNPLKDTEENMIAIIESFELIYAQRDNLTLLIQNGQSDYFDRILTDLMLDVSGSMSAQSPERYRLYIITGAMISVLSQWLLSGAHETPEEMAKITVYYLKKGVLD